MVTESAAAARYGLPVISLVIPVFNEHESLRPLAAEIVEACAGLGEWEAVFVDDGSNDGSADIIRQLAAERPEFVLVRLRRNFGKSTALMAGFDAARGDVIVTLDADGQDDPREIPRMIALLDEGHTLVSGWKRQRNDPPSKTVPSRVFNGVTAALSGVRIHDFNCGLKAYRANAARELTLYGEMYRLVPVIGYQRGWKVTELEVNHRPRVHGQSKFGAERFLRGLFDLMTVLFLGRYRHRPLHLFGGLGALLVIAGFAICAYLSFEKIVNGASISDRPLLLLGVLILVVGVQVLSLGLISELITMTHAEQRGARTVRDQVDEVVRRESAAPAQRRAAAVG